MVRQRDADAKNMVKNQTDVSKQVEKTIKDNLTASSGQDPAWKALTHTPGLMIWRIRKLKLELVDTAQHGTFFDGDSYILLHTYLTKSQKISYDVFMWIGKSSTADEYGTAAFKMAELDVVVLNDNAIQHREVQGNESQKFLNLFEKLSILKGGHETGFKKVDQGPPEPRLLHICGEKKNVKITEISCRRDNLSEDDVFVLDLGDKIFQINGSKSSKDERMKGASVVMEIKSRNGKAKSEIIDDYTASSKHPEIENLPFKNKATHVKKVTETREKSLWKVSDETGEVKMTKISSGSVKKSNLDSKDVFIVDSGMTIYIWVGKQTSNTEKMVSMSFGQKYAESIKQPKIPLVRIGEGTETEEFLNVVN